MNKKNLETRITLRLPADLFDHVTDIADQLDVTPSEYIRQMLYIAKTTYDTAQQMTIKGVSDHGNDRQDNSNNRL